MDPPETIDFGSPHRNQRNLRQVKDREADLAKRKLASDFFTAPETASDAIPLLPQRIVREIERPVDEKPDHPERREQPTLDEPTSS